MLFKIDPSNKPMKTLFLLFFSLSAFCQTYTITGSIKDTANVPIPFANVFTAKGQGTLTNENGEFVLKVSSLPTQIFISHVSYQTISVQIKDETSTKIILKEGIKTLSEVKVGSYALEIVKKAVEKVNGDSIYNHFARGFYRRIQKEGDKYTVLHEIFLNANINGKQGISAWQPTESRYTKHDGNVDSGMALAVTIQSCSPSPRTRFFWEGEFMPLKDYSKYYSFEIENIINENTPDEIAVVSCTPRQAYERSFTGKFYIKTSNSSILRIKGRRLGSTKGRTHNFWFKLKEAYWDMNINFREEGDVSVLTGLDLDYVMNVQYASSVNRQIVDNMSLIMYDYSPPKNGEEKNLTIKIPSESEIFSTTQASPEFWENNPVIKRTPLQDEVIKAFEKKSKKKGGNMFPTPK